MHSVQKRLNHIAHDSHTCVFDQKSGHKQHADPAAEAVT